MTSLEEEVEKFILANKKNLEMRDEPQRIQLLADQFQIGVDEAQDLYDRFKRHFHSE